MNLHLRTAVAYAPNSCKESQGEDSKDELDDVDEEVSSSAVFVLPVACAFWQLVCLRPLPLLKAVFERSLGSWHLAGSMCLLCHMLAASWTRMHEQKFCLRTAYARLTRCLRACSCTFWPKKQIQRNEMEKT